MLKIGLFSDTHKHIANLNRAFVFLQDMGLEMIIHLGDDYNDSDALGISSILRVPGVFCSAYQDPKIANRRIEDILGWRTLLTHTVSSHPNDLPGDIKPEELIQEKKVDIVLYGHTHIPEIRKEQGIIFVNPGHLKDDDKRGHGPSFGLLKISEKEFIIEIFDLKNTVIYKKDVFKKEE